MKNVFLSFSFRDPDRQWASDIQNILAGFRLQVITGEHLGGRVLSEEVKSRIRRCDGLIALLTRREEIVGGGWTTHEWVKDEINFARENNKHAIALVEDGIDVSGLQASHEYIKFDRNDIDKAFLNLIKDVSEWIKWEEDPGTTIKAGIFPEALAAKLRHSNGDYQCRYRLIAQGQSTPWKDVVPIPEQGGTFIYLQGVKEDYLIQIEVTENSKTGMPKKWLSLASPQWIRIELQEGGQTI
jgi:hypothetical protein